MISLKVNIAGKLLELKKAGKCKKVSSGYPRDFTTLPLIAYYETDNSDVGITAKEVLSDVEYTIDLWDDSSLSQLAEEVDKKMKSLGLYRTKCLDVPTLAGIRHKVMTYAGRIDTKNNIIYRKG